MKRFIVLLLIIWGVTVGCKTNSVSNPYADEQPLIGPTKTLDVPGAYPTIGAAIDAAGNGDFIRVATGRYAESIQVTSKDISLRGAGKDLSVILGSIEFNSSEASLEGFTIQGGGVHIKDSPARISGNKILHHPGPGLWVEHCHAMVISDNEIQFNGQEGILIDDSTGIIERNTVFGNVNDGIAIANSSPTLQSNNVRANGRDGISIRGFSSYAAPVLISNASHDNGGNSNYDIICFGLNTNPTGLGNTFGDCLNCKECRNLDEKITYEN